MDADRNVIGLLKKKTAWYIICRAIREKVRNALTAKKEWDLLDVKKRVSELPDAPWVGDMQTISSCILHNILF